ncbi:hypothetical protein V0U79_12060 [Hyphobacterium sp. HN65]|uniref:DUF3667 domain-containing protein n=1 Tax=Hyphobacterium lacteum TaxID=3116575 RepID=A0ABU7LT73_9PROT|nr:hypothetical protein [Hyphobacterium sp. HN65]MEE2527104.1 hypothetical protein [Hyphobacterium sp. HN65]
MSDPDKPEDVRPSRGDIDDVADAAIGVDTRIFQTIVDTFLHTPRVVAAAYAGDRHTYVPIIRLFLVLFGLQFALMAFANLPVGLTLASLERSGETSENIAAWLEAGPQCQAQLAPLDPQAESYAAARADVLQSCRTDVESTLQTLASYTSAPLVFISTLPFLILLKLFAWRRSVFGHLLAYLAATNASYLLVLPFYAAAIFIPSPALLWSGMAVSTFWYFVAMARLLYRFYSQNRTVVAFQLLAQLAMVPVIFLIVSIAQLVFVHLALGAFHDLSILELMATNAGSNIEVTTS